MSLDSALLAILACPEDKGPLYYIESEAVLYNPRLQRTYALLPRTEDYRVGSMVAPPLPVGTILLREEKKPEEDFISRICVLRNEADGWQFTAYCRTQSGDPFTVATVTDHPCGGSGAREELTLLATSEMVVIE